MFITTLLSAPQNPCVEPAMVDALRNAWGGGDIHWLSAGEAAEFPLDHLPDNQWDVWEDLQKQGIDLVIQRAEGRKKSLLLADMDSTMIRQECIDELADEAGVGARVAEITARAMNGEIDFEGALRERVGLLKGLPASVINQVIQTRIEFMGGAKTLLATMKANGAHAALVSGGFTTFTAYVAETLGFDEHRANNLMVADGHLTGEVGEPILGQQAKVDALADITKRLSLLDRNVIAVGDGANDLAMLKRAGTGVALHAKPSVAIQSDVRITYGNLTALLYIQGYKRSEFVTV